MKIIKYSLAIVLAIIILFLAMGFITPSIEYNCEVQINKPAIEVWAVMSDESKVSDWIKGYKSSELISGTPNTLGAVTKIYIEENGTEMSMQETITALEPNKRMAMNFTMDFMDMDYDMRLEDKGAYTIVKTNSKTVGNGMIAKSMISFMPSSMEAQEIENLGNLKRLVEENTTDYFKDLQPDIETLQEDIN